MTAKDRQQFRSRLLLCTCVSLFTGFTYFQMSLAQGTIQVFFDFGWGMKGGVIELGRKKY